MISLSKIAIYTLLATIVTFLILYMLTLVQIPFILDMMILLLMYAIIAILIYNPGKVPSKSVSIQKVIVSGATTFLIFIFASSIAYGIIYLISLEHPSYPATPCLSPAGYQCTAVVYNHGVVGIWPAGNVILTVGQSTGANWASANIFYVPKGTYLSNGVPTSIPTGSAAIAPLGGTGNTIGYTTITPLGSGLISGQTASVSLGVPSPESPGSVPVGHTESGTIWAQYTIAGNRTLQYAQMGTITLWAV